MRLREKKSATSLSISLFASISFMSKLGKTSGMRKDQSSRDNAIRRPCGVPAAGRGDDILPVLGEPGTGSGLGAGLLLDRLLDLPRDRDRHPVLVLAAVENRADMPSFAQLGAGKADGRHRSYHGVAPGFELTAFG
jgi:hypothetical protein